jgi:hypothetical protein
MRRNTHARPITQSLHLEHVSEARMLQATEHSFSNHVVLATRTNVQITPTNSHRGPTLALGNGGKLIQIHDIPRNSDSAAFKCRRRLRQLAKRDILRTLFKYTQATWRQRFALRSRSRRLCYVLAQLPVVSALLLTCGTRRYCRARIQGTRYHGQTNRCQATSGMSTKTREQLAPEEVAASSG